MKRRAFALAIGSMTAVPRVTRAQQAGNAYRIGLLAPYSADVFMPRHEQLRAQLQSRGYEPGKNLVIDVRLANGRLERLPQLAEELVRANVDLIVPYTTPAAHAARAATDRIPIVLSGIADPIATGLVASLSRPGGNITGASTNLVDLGGKTLELAAELKPGLRRVTFLSHSADPAAARFVEEVKRAGVILGLEVSEQPVAAMEQIEDAVRRSADGGAQALVIQPIIAIQHGKVTAVAALRHRLPSVAAWTTYAANGGLACYGPDTELETPRIIAEIIDKILKGTRPGDIPVQLTTRFLLNVNMRTARALGLPVSATVLGRADEVIE